MADLNVALVLRLVDKATAPARAAMRALSRIGGEDLIAKANTVARGSRLMTAGLGNVTRAATTAGAAVAAYSGVMVGIAAAFVRPAAQFERFNVQLTNLEGSAEGAKRAMGWIEDFATRTPLELEDTVAAYTRLKAFGLDPTNGSLMAMVDTMAATGGGVEQLDGMVLALGQAWTKGKLQGEEAMQLLERGVPVWDLLAQKTGKSASELMALSSAGKLGREEITLLIEALGEQNAGAAEGMSKTWDGIVSNLMDYWTKFQRMVMDAGLFDFMKGKLQDLLTFLSDAAADGRMQAWAEATSTAVITALKAIESFGIWIHDTWQTVFPILDQVAQAIGGWDVVGWIALLVLFRGSVIGLTLGFAQMAGGALLVGQGLLGIGLQGATALPRLVRLGAFLRVGLVGAFTRVGTAISWLSRAFLLAGRALLANPIFAVVAAIAALAYVIYDNWDGIVAYFTGKIERVAAAFDQGLLNGVLALIAEFNPFLLIQDAAEGLFTYITGWTFADVSAAFLDAFGFDPFVTPYEAAQRFFTYLTGWSFTDISNALVEAFTSIDFVQIGIDMMNALWEGIKQVVGQITAWLQEQFASITPDWMRSGFSSGAVGAGGYDGMAGAMDGNPALAGEREIGGPVRAGRTYAVNERGQELFTPDRDGWIIPNRRLAQDGGRAGGGGITIGGITINAAPGQSPEMIARAVRAEMERLARQRRFALDDGGAYA